MMAVETILVHKPRSSQITGKKYGLFCEVCNREASSREVLEVDNTPSPFSG
jgi:hypothetical protein